MVPTAQQDMVMELRKPDIEEAVKKLYDHYFEGIVAQICINGGNQEDGADIFQEAVLVLIDKVKTGQFRGDSSIKTFLSAIARNLWLHELRTRGRRNKREVIYMDGGDKTEEPLHTFFDTQNTNALQEVLEQVGETCKKILTGFYYEDKSMKELLTEFNYENEQVLRNRKSRCMKKMKELLSTNKELLRTLKPLSIYEP
jgi:RNA polymerase sigma factor (sigma-70 family)